MDELLHIFELTTDPLTKEEFRQLSPALIWLTLTPDCIDDGHQHANNTCQTPAYQSKHLQALKFYYILKFYI